MWIELFVLLALEGYVAGPVLGEDFIVGLAGESAGSKQ